MRNIKLITLLGGVGLSASKKVEDLFKEIIEHDSELVERSGELFRKLRVLGLLVSYTHSDGTKYKLKEQHQYFHEDARGRVRENWASVGEKLKTNEKLNIDSINRTLSEELQISVLPENIHFLGIDKKEKKESSSYPGLNSEYPIYKYEITLKDSQYIPEGYFEVQGGKTTCFHWEKVSTE